jgi:hypothetical protein
MSTYLTNAHLCKLVACLDALFQRLAENKTSQETAGERIACSVRIDDVFVLHMWYREHLWALRFGGADQDGGLGAVGDDDDARAGCVDFGQRCDGFCDFG